MRIRKVAFKTLRVLYCLLHYGFSLLYVISVLGGSHDHRAVIACKILFSNYYSLADHLLIPLLGLVCFDICALFSVSDNQAINDVTENMVFPFHYIPSTEK
jgi:hypothetical protein